MNSKAYISNHDFGLQEEHSLVGLNRISLRNIQDLHLYLKSAFELMYDAQLRRNILTFKQGSRYRIILKKV